MSDASQAHADVLDNDQKALHACMICGKRFSDYDEVQQHYRIEHQHKRK